jgi:hypothetical protein
VATVNEAVKWDMSVFSLGPICSDPVGKCFVLRGPAVKGKGRGHSIK